MRPRIRLSVMPLETRREARLIKEPGTVKRTPWHHDMLYWPLVGLQVCTIWLARDRVTKDSGAVECARGSPS